MNMRTRYLVPGLVAGLVLAGCGADPADSVETFVVEPGDFTISLRSKGELMAAESTAIMPPAGSRAPRTVQWLAPNFSWVEAGDVVVRFDVTDAEREAGTAGIEIDKVDLQVLGKQRELDRMLAELGNDLELVDIEKLMAEEFDFENELAYSRFEIIDAMRDQALLDYKSEHLEGKKGTYSERQEAEVAVLAAQRTTQESKFQQQQALLENQEILAPHDGFFVIERSWYGERIDVGSTVFSGNKLAAIPNLEKMLAELRVLETEAAGLAQGQKVDVIIDAYPDRPLTGAIQSISATAAPVERDSPVKYFTVQVALDQADPEWITPGAVVTATIHIDQALDAIAVPNQALFREDGRDQVLVREGGQLVKRDVTLGLRGPNRSQVVTGLEAGDEVALFQPSGAADESQA